MTLDIELFWKLISDSQLLESYHPGAVKSKWPGDDPARVAEALVTDRVISPLQRDVLLAGHSGPFQFGRYLIIDRIDNCSGDTTFSPFAGRDLRTQHPVMLNFFPGTSEHSPQHWRMIERRVRKLAKCRHDHLIETFQTISLPDYRFVVSQQPQGMRLSQKLPTKGRLKLAQAAPLMLQIARAVEALIDAGIEPELPSTKQLLARIWLGPNATALLQPTWFADQYGTSHPPAEALLRLLLRISGGKFPNSDNYAELIEKSALTGELKGIALRCFDHSVDAPLRLDQFRAALDKVVDSIPQPKHTETLRAFRRVLRSAQISATSIAAPIQSVPAVTALQTDSASSELASLPSSLDPRVLAARKAADLRRKARWKQPAAVAAMLFAMLTAVAIWARSANEKIITPIAQNAGLKTPPSDETLAPPIDLAPPPAKKITRSAADFIDVAYVQEILKNDATRLWESPTTGKPIDFRYVPSSTAILLHMRPVDLRKSDQGQRLLNGASITFTQPLKTLNDSLGIALEQIRILTVALYPGNSGTYQAIYRVSVTNETTLSNLKASWGNPDEARTPTGKTMFATDDTAYLITSADTDDNISFVAGAPTMVQELDARNGTSVLSRPLRQLAGRTDHDRHLSLIASPKSLTDRFGRKLWGNFNATIVPPLRVFFPDEVEGFAVLLHLDAGDYLELHIDHSPDLTAAELKRTLDEKVHQTINEIGDFASALPELGYWNKVRQRTAPMAARLSRSLRWDVEFGNVIANAWLPPDAIQNLIAASELTLAFANSAASTIETYSQHSPQSIKELLASRRSLNIANPPDLNILLFDLARDINDDFPDMPFRFKITLMGNDLQKEGITQNQRPGPMAFDDMTVSEILTQIMISANPDKNISGPADADCKLVWVVVEDKSTNNRGVAVTTRAAATIRNDTLPAAFLTPSP